jgi:signal peptide peptidase SppA
MKSAIARLLPASLRKRLAPDWTPPVTVAVVRLSGAIGMSMPLRGGIDFASVVGALEAAFDMRRAKAVALVINSPGGSPVQSSLIYKRIRALAKEKELPVYAFAEDVAASGGYMLACAADEIYADESSIVGSIGVVSAGFGFTGLIEKLGIERRVHTAGESKAMLDPFKPEKPDEVERLEALQREVHENFKALVRRSRGGRLQEPAEGLFTGEFWAGQAALDRGLIDGLGDLRTVMRAKYGENVRFKVVGERKSFLQRRFGLGGLEGEAGGGIGEGVGRGLLAAFEARSLWARFGL